jgi:hypothetical protein
MKIFLVALLAIGTIVSAKHIGQEKQYFRTTARTTTTTRATTTTTKPSTTTTTTTTTEKPTTTTHEPVQQQQQFASDADSCETAKTLTPIGMELDALFRLPIDLPVELNDYRFYVEMALGPVFPFIIPEEAIESIFWKKSTTCPGSIDPAEPGRYLEQFVPTYLENFWTPVTRTEMSDQFEGALATGADQLMNDPAGAMTEISEFITTEFKPQIDEIDAQIDALMMEYIPMIQSSMPILAAVGPTVDTMINQLTIEVLANAFGEVFAGNCADPLSFAKLCFGEELIAKLIGEYAMASMMMPGK